MSDINAEIIDYLKLEKQVRLDGLEMIGKSAEIPQRLLKEVSIFDRWIEHLANEATTSDSGLHLQRVSGSALDIAKQIPQVPQTQAALNDQLKILRIAANKLGLYDAADFIKRD